MAQDQSHPTEFKAPSLDELRPLFPAYEMESFIAQGGMGAVYKATQKSLDRPVAIKILPSEFGDDPKFRSSFEAEAKAMARLNHPNLISVYDFGDVEGMLFIVMEFVHGKALYYSSHNKAIDPPVALDLVSKIGRGLAHAHRGGIIHRDIKPANILLDTNARPKIGDFGLARSIDWGKEDGLVFGTPGYTAPEVFSHPTEIDGRSDIFSVGALLYELISGKQPQANSHSLTTGTDPRIDSIIKKATHPDPTRRYAHVDQLADEIDALLPKLSGPRFATGPANAAPPIAGPSTVLSSSKPKSGAFAALFVIMLVVAGAAAGYFLLKDPPEKKAKAASSDPQKKGTQASDSKPPKTKEPERRNPPKKQGVKVTSEDNPKPKPVKPEPSPTPEPPTESTMEGLARLAKNLIAGKRDEFPSQAIKSGQSTYLLVEDKRTWDEANQFAREHGAHLAILSTLDHLSWFQKNFSTSDPVWLGGSDSGFEKKWFWIDGQPLSPSLWRSGSPDNRTGQSQNGEDFLAISPGTPSLEDRYRNEAFPFLLEWRLDGSTPATLEKQLALTGEALSNKRTPIFPPGTYNVGGSRFLLVEKEIPWDEADRIARRAGGHLAVPSNESESAFLSMTLKDILEEGHNCWIGGRRNTKTPDVWQYVTGESFTFLSWHEDQPDNANQNEDCLALTLSGDSIGATDESKLGHRNSHFFIEWSVPSLRNMPPLSLQETDEDKLLAALEEIREAIRERHEKKYRDFRKEKAQIIEDFVEDTISTINNQERLSAPIKARLVEQVKQYKEDNKLPDELPRFTPRRIQDEFEDAKADLKELEEDYKEDLEKARNDYLDALEKQTKAVVKNGEEAKAEVFVLESSMITRNDKRLRQILNGDKVPLPEKPEKEEENDDAPAN